MLKKEYKTSSYSETQELGGKLVSFLDSKKVFALYGDLGCGKTTFTQGFARALGIQSKIISPTFIIIRSYKINYGTFRRLYHIDLYRIENVYDLDDLGLEEIINDKENIVVIEWPEKMEKLLKNALKIKLKYVSDNERRLIFD